jgi:hypothetical protein
MTVRLRVEPAGEDPFVAKFRQNFPGLIPMDGWQAKVIYDPKDRSRVAVLADQISPPGGSHELAERRAVHREQVRKATAEGRLAEFFQEDIAARAGQDIRVTRRDGS